MSGSVQSSSSGIAGRIVRAAGAQGINQLVRVVQLFLLVPICLSAWGTAVYEDWILLNSVTAFLILADFGFVQHTTVKLIGAWSRGDGEEFSREWTVALGLFGALSATLIGILAVAWIDPGWTSFIPVRQMQATELASIAILLALSVVLSILMNLGLGAYRARGDLSRSYHVSSISTAAQTAAIAAPAMLGAGPVDAAAGNCLAIGLAVVAIIADFCWRYPDMTWKPIWPPFRELLRNARQAVEYLASPVSITVMLNGPNLILAHSGAPQGAIALFTASRTIAGAARQLPYQFAHPAGVELAALLARGDRPALSRVYESATRALAVIVGVLSGGTLMVAPLVMTLWTRGKIEYDPALMLLLVGATTICAPSQVAFTLLWYGGHPGRLSKALALSTGIAMGLAVLLAPWFEANGVAAGVGVGEVIGVAVFLTVAVDRLLGRRPASDLLRNLWIAVLAFSMSAGLGYLVRRLITLPGWFGLLEFAVIWAVPAAVGMYWVLLTGPQKARAAGIATSFLRIRRTKPCPNPADLG